MKRIYNLILISLGLFIITSCSDDFITKEPMQNLSDETAIENVNDAQVALTGVYDRLQTSGYWGRGMQIYADLFADNGRMNTANSGRYLNTYNWNIVTNTSPGLGMWDNAYDGINRANKVLEAIESKGFDADDLKGQALALRAMLHFDMVRLFAQTYTINDATLAPGSDGNGGHLGVPLMLASDPYAEPSRNTVNEVYTQVIADLEEAMTLMDGDVDYFYFNKWGAEALLARVYLTRASGGGTDADYTAARDHALNVINSGPYSLVSNADYIASWIADFNTESIFYLKYTSVDYLYTDALGGALKKSGYGDVVANEDLLGLIPDGDVRQHLFYANHDDNEVQMDFYDEDKSAENYYVNKYPGREGTDGVDNLPLIRLSEMYLIAAEAELELGNTGPAEDYIMEIIDRAKPGALITEYGATLREQIYNTIRIELCFEGHRTFDIKRRQDDIIRISVTNESVPRELLFPSYLFALPIPQEEMDANANMVQNYNY
ncbi:MAG: hypothetical protein A2X15_12215 [Bacteroidetes bacterium GWB2_32_14]|nr:MAG: hypothetical protein A2X15_12215 [Bacteroidetes bacterium GWB2_32_14]